MTNEDPNHPHPNGKYAAWIEEVFGEGPGYPSGLYPGEPEPEITIQEKPWTWEELLEDCPF